MNVPSVTRLLFTASLCLTTSLCLAAGTAYAQAPQTQTPQASQTAQKPYEPTVGQAGKDVVWVPTPDSARREDARHGARSRRRTIVIDLGSGDGRTVIAAAKRGARALGHRVQPGHGRAVEAQCREGGRRRQGDVRQGRHVRDAISRRPRSSRCSCCPDST